MDPLNIRDISMFSFECPVGRFFSVHFSEAFLEITRILSRNRPDMGSMNRAGTGESSLDTKRVGSSKSKSCSSTAKRMPFSFSTSPKSFN